MHLNPESKAVIDKLNESQSVSATSTRIGPFDQITKDVLQIIIENYEQLNGLSGESRAKKFLDYYKRLLEDRAKSGEEKKDENIEKQQKEVTQENAKQTKWYIHNIECHSIRGIDSYGETFPFSFEGKSNLIYGPNGSGKSSLLVAVIWAFTGTTITDASNSEQDTDIHQKTDGIKKGTRIRSNWPLISTLPESNDIKSIVPDSWVKIELKTEDQTNTLYIKQSLTSGLEVGTDKDALKPCKSLEAYGIKPLDLQISLIAPTVLSRNTLDNADSIIKIVSMILGFDVLTDIGDLAANIGRNRTTYANSIESGINSNWTSLQDKLARLPDPLDEKSPARDKLQDLISKDKPTLKELTDKNTLIQDEIDNANKSVAEILGVDSDDKGLIEGLAEKLIEAIVYLEKEFKVVFPSFAEVQYDAEQHGGKTIQEIEKEFNTFCVEARRRIRQRIDWWKKEKEEGSKLSLKLRASDDYDAERMECPVCDQSIKDLPIKAELERLKTLDQELQRELKDFFKDLLEELKQIVSGDIKNISQSLPSERILADWGKMKDVLDDRLNGIVSKYEPKVQSLCKTFDDISVESVVFFDEDDPELLAASDTFVKACNDCLKAIEILKWGDINFGSIEEQLQKLLTLPEETSLLAVLSKGKSKASDIGPLNIIKAQLGEIIKLRGIIVALEADHNLIKSLKLPIDEIKKLSAFALEKTMEVFNKIKTVSDKNWKLLYDESPTGLIPSKLVLERGKKIEPFLSKQNYEVAGKYFANSGLQRSLALSFLCALIKEHDGGMSFVLFDDPILSLDEDHREKWADRILAPIMEDGAQIILATHQSQFQKHCSHDFKSGKIIELNPRDRKQALSWQPGSSLDRIKDSLDSNWKAVPNLLRKYCEQVLITLQSYSDEDFFSPHNLSNSLRKYKNLRHPNPLVSGQRDQIIKWVEDERVDRVLNPGSHALTEDDLTKPIVKTCLDLIKSHVKNNFESEMSRLKALRKRKMGGRIITITLSNTTTFTFNESLQIKHIGRAAARPESWVVDEAEQETNVIIQKCACVRVTGHTFDPIARCGQCILLSESDDIPADGDLVVGESSEQGKYLRRISFDDESAFLYSINPLKITAPLQVDRKTLSLHRVIGVLYEPCRHCNGEGVNGNEWHPCNNIDPSYFENKKMIAVEGDSMEPIARKGQKVLVEEGMSPQDCTIESGGLAVIETDDESVGNEIKRVYPKENNWILVSANPLEPYTPDIIPIKNIKKVWPLKGVIFEITENQFQLPQ